MKKKYDYFIYYFPLFAFLFIGMGSILLSVSLSSCSSSVKNPLLLCADSLMEVSPDSALSILESISSPQSCHVLIERFMHCCLHRHGIRIMYL